MNAATTTKSTSQAEDIQREMRQLRAELRDDVQELVAGTCDLTDWTYYVRTYPWLCLAAVAVIGYIVVPGRKSVVQPDAKTILELARNNPLIVKVEERPARTSLVGMVASTVASMMIHKGMDFLSHQLVQGLGTNPSHVDEGLEAHERYS